jgi:NAD(P)H dehydrogenase (quinone)
MLRFVGFDVLVPHIVHAPVKMTDEQRRAELERYSRRLAHVAGEEPMDVGPY